MSKMNVTLLAKKLRARLVILKKERAKKLKAYDVAFVKWKRDVVAWARGPFAKNIADLTKARMRERYGRYADIPQAVFENAPRPPTMPTDKQERVIRSKLRYLGITGCKDYHVSDRELEEWFGDESDET